MDTLAYRAVTKTIMLRIDWQIHSHTCQNINAGYREKAT